MELPKNSREARDQAEEIKAMLILGKIGYREAVEMIKPRIEVLEKRANEVAREHGMKPIKIPINKYLR